MLLAAAHYGLVLAAVYGSGCCAAAAAATRQRGCRALRALLRGRPLLRRHCVRRRKSALQHRVRRRGSYFVAVYTRAGESTDYKVVRACRQVKAK